MRLLPTRCVLSRATIVLVLTAVVSGALTSDSAWAALPGETKQQIDERMQWWRDAKYGMFIHWGLYAVPAGRWKGKVTESTGEWLMHTEKIPVTEYKPLAKQFNPVKFDAVSWARLAKQSGMKYMVITSKHHDGFSMFDSKLTDYDIMNTPYGRDVMKPLADECRKQGIQFCFYHSILDWYHPDAKGANWPKYREFMQGQLKELLTGYGPIGVMWFDGQWADEWDSAQGRDLERFLRGMQPKLIVNNRIAKRNRDEGDFGTPEQEIPPTGMPGNDWETCMTMNTSWGFKADDHKWKSTEELLHNLVDIVSKGGNFLLNIGPTAAGEIPEPSVERLREIGAWMKDHGESIYGTSASPFRRLGWGRATTKPGKLYLHVFQWPDGPLDVPALRNKVKRAYLLTDAKRKPLGVESLEGGVRVNVPKQAPNKLDSVVVLEIDGTPRVDDQLLVEQQPDGSIRLTAFDATIHGKIMQYDGDHLGYWTNKDDSVSYDMKVAKPGKFDVEVTYGIGPKTSGAKYTVDVAGKQLHGTAENTGRGTNFRTKKLGSVELARGKHTITVKADEKPGEYVMNLKQITLRPIE